MARCKSCKGSGYVNRFGSYTGHNEHLCPVCWGAGSDPHATFKPSFRKAKTGGTRTGNKGNSGLLALLVLGFLGYMAITWIGDNQVSILATLRHILLFWILPFLGVCALFLCWLAGGRTLQGMLRYALIWAIYSITAFVVLRLSLGFLLQKLAGIGGHIPPGIAPYAAAVLALPISLLLMFWVSGTYGMYGRARGLFLRKKKKAARMSLNCGRELIRDQKGALLTTTDWKTPFVREFIYMLMYTKTLGVCRNLDETAIDTIARTNMATLMRLCHASDAIQITTPARKEGLIFGHVISENYFHDHMTKYNAPSNLLNAQITGPSHDIYQSFREACVRERVYPGTRAFRNSLKLNYWFLPLERFRSQHAGQPA